MQTIITIIVDVITIIIIIIIIIIVWFGPMCFLLNSSPQRQLPRLLNELDYLSVHLENLCSSFFGRPLPLM